MSGRRIAAIVKKDLRDAWRDGRIVVLLLMPIGSALISTVGNGPETLPKTTAAIVDPGVGAVARELRRATGRSGKLVLLGTPDAAAARRLVAAEDAAFAVIVTAGRPPSAEILVGTGATPADQAVVALVPDALARASGRPPGVRTRVRAVPPLNQKPADVAGVDGVTIVFSLVLLVTFVAMMVVPIQTGEEIETGTFGALRLAATGREILAAKALSGYIFGMAGIGLLVGLSGIGVHDPPLFFGAALALIVSLVGFGLLAGLVAPNSNAINTYGGFLLVPLVGAAVAVFFVDAGVLATILDLLPFSQAAKLLADGLSPQPPFHAGMLAWAVIAVWAVAGYAILSRIAARREL